jgi:hypothetical protein
VARWIEMLASSPSVKHSAEKSLHCFASITAASISGRGWASLLEERAEGWRVVWVDPGRPPQPPMRLGVQGTPPSGPPPRRGSASVEGCAQAAGKVHLKIRPPRAANNSTRKSTQAGPLIAPALCLADSIEKL